MEDISVEDISRQPQIRPFLNLQKNNIGNDYFSTSSIEQPKGSSSRATSITAGRELFFRNGHK